MRLFSLLVIFAFSYLPAFAQESYQATDIDAIFTEWSGKTKDSKPVPMVFSDPMYVTFDTIYAKELSPCKPGLLTIIAFTTGLKLKTKENHCVGLRTQSGRELQVHVRETAEEKFKAIGSGSSVVIRGRWLAYTVEEDRSKSAPFLYIDDVSLK